MDNNLNIENGLFKYNGVMGRLYYFRNSFIIVVLALLIMLLISANSELTFKRENIRYLAIIACLIISPLEFINVARRIADIRGTRDKVNLFTTGYILLSFVPYLGKAIGVLLLFMEGKVTSKNR